MLSITPFHRRAARSNTNTRKRLGHVRSRLRYSSSKEPCPQVFLRDLGSPANTFTRWLSPVSCGRLTPLEKSPSRSPHARSPPAPALLQGETFPRRAEKHLAVTTLFLFFPSLHFSPSLRSISKSQNKLPPLSRWKTAVLHHAEPPLSS